MDAGDPRRSSCRNIRIADQRIGDIKAQAAALTIGERRLTALIDRYGADDGRSRRSPRCAAAPRARCAPTSPTIPDGVYDGEAFVDTDGVVDEPLTIAMKITKSRATTLHLRHDRLEPALPRADEQRHRHDQVVDLSRHASTSSPTCRSTPAPSSRCTSIEPEGTFLYASYPRPVSGCAAEVSQRIAEAVFAALAQAIPDQLFAAPAGTSAISASAATIPSASRDYIMYLFSGGGYGGNQGGDGLTNGCSTIGISKMPPVEVHGAVLSRCCSRSSRCARARAAPASTAAASASTTRSAAARRGARLDGDGSRPHRPAGRRWAARTAASTPSR